MAQIIINIPESKLTFFKELFHQMGLSKNIKIVEQENVSENQVKTAAQLLLKDYETDKELTSFTSLDYQDFYETK